MAKTASDSRKGAEWWEISGMGPCMGFVSLYVINVNVRKEGSDKL